MKLDDIDRWMTKMTQMTDSLTNASGKLNKAAVLNPALGKKLSRLADRVSGTGGKLEKLTDLSTQAGQKIDRLTDKIDKLADTPVPTNLGLDRLAKSLLRPKGKP